MATIGDHKMSAIVRCFLHACALGTILVVVMPISTLLVVTLVSAAAIAYLWNVLWLSAVAAMAWLAIASACVSSYLNGQRQVRATKAIEGAFARKDKVWLAQAFGSWPPRAGLYNEEKFWDTVRREK